jgi:hypothetical protein
VFCPVVVDPPRRERTQYLAEAKEKYDGGALPNTAVNQLRGFMSNVHDASVLEWIHFIR